MSMRVLEVLDIDRVTLAKTKKNTRHLTGFKEKDESKKAFHIKYADLKNDRG